MLQKLLNGRNIDILDKYSLRLFKKEDIEDIVIMLQNPNVSRYLYFTQAKDTDVYRAYFSSVAEAIAISVIDKQKPENIVLSVINNSNKQFVGIVGATKVDFITGVYELGYQIKEEYWGLGIATSATRLLIETLKADYRVHKLQIDFYGQNKASQAIALKLGFTKEGQLTNYYRLDDGFDDKIIYGWHKQHKD